MATTTDTTTLFSGKRRSVHHIQGRNTDGTAETNVTKVDISTLKGPNGGAPSQVTVEGFEYIVQGFNDVELLWDNNTNVSIANMSGAGEVNWLPFGGKHNPATGTGDILLTSRDAAADDTYDITLYLKHEE